MEKIKKCLRRTWFYEHYLNRKYLKLSEKEAQMNLKIRGPIVERFFPKGGIGAELGVLKGDFSRVLFNCTKPRELHLIDPWFFLNSEWSWAGGNPSTVDALCKVLQENKNEINKRRIFVHVQDDLKVLDSFPDHFFDWVYLDSSHAYEHTKAELKKLLRKVKPEGVIGGDDWRPDPNHRHHGVFKAVTEFMQMHNYRLSYSNEINLQWVIEKNV